MPNTRRERAIALHPVEITNQQLMEILSTVRADMSIIKGQIGNVQQTLTNMNGRIGILATPSTNTVTNLTVAAPVVISNHEPTREESNAVYQAHIHNLMWKPKLSLRTPENILVNNLKPRWDTNVAFNKSPNREIAERLLSNLERRFGSSSMRRSNLQKRLHINFTSRTHRERMSDDEIAETNALTRRAARADDNECCRVLAYKDNKEAIDLVMLRDCANTLQKAVMSDGESDNEMDEDGIKHVIHIVQPSWRSDECNRFIALVDTYAVQAIGSSANKRIRRITTSVSNSAVPDNISPNFPRWGLRDGL
ncbi:hypothetical protein PHYBLDRAFT_144538 [Phycomyces blakesleeanus NRRL 1555(-)]|uniref:Homeodomain-like DNA binding domain-containing transcription factor n=1 Tax=Phycomyces blakesleeanus (strain ATCC 8743b / DSM 1359 / FGSC 10004 / NBRC 33097 / NRRL 1555) TaxID=763407 RepID=A0A162NGT5_PHYB8|nr:hypothetical protein PHYBLDRAFT_144538 [Phycomyces blakesleeanus NRRL 1555(-)]OAD74078.1 hypothetical protein PHYBLDRAFT_144538 [Phycomyces blakesleeanus NRRL 1555(-)]|eukprot:XP_018292118.1 hypothetical protein PHYBLDRAFT_144538 [Phycomyces blakesleeanus NRRL 1555(-)]